MNNQIIGNNQNKQKSIIPKERIQNIQAVENYFDVIQCSVCYNVVVEPVFCMQCEKNICLSCYKEWLQISGKVQCPNCKQEKLNQHFENKLLQKLLSRIKVYCLNNVNGCPEILDYNTRSDHESNCQYIQQKCTNYGCKEMILQKDFNNHLIECPCTQIQCPRCNTIMQQKLLNLHNQNICPCRLVQCEMCQRNFEYQGLANHQQNCPCKPQQCPECLHSFPAQSFPNHQRTDCLEIQLNDCIIKCKEEEEKRLELEAKLEEHDNCIATLEYQLENVSLQIEGFTGHVYFDRGQNAANQQGS